MCLLDKAVIIITSKDLAVKSTDLVLLNYLYISRFSYLQQDAHRRAFWLCRKIARPFFHLNANETKRIISKKLDVKFQLLYKNSSGLRKF